MSYLLELSFVRFMYLITGLIKLQKFKSFVAPSAAIKCRSKIKLNGYIMIAPHCTIDALSTNGIEFGEATSIGHYTTIICTGSLKQIGKGFKVGNNVGLGEKCHYGCAGGIEIGDNTIIGIYVTMHSENHIFSNPNIPIRNQGVQHKGIKIGKNCWIGAKATILDGTHIGDGCVVAAGAVVSGKFPSNCVIGGVPAKIIKEI